MSDIQLTAEGVHQQTKWTRTLALLGVPTLFLILCVIGVYYSGQPVLTIINYVIERFGRNAFLVVSLIIPVVAGIGLNFSIVIGAMAAQMALIFTMDWGFSGFGGLMMAMLLAVPPAVLFGYLVGQLFNRALGREMVTGLIAGYFANGIYQLIFLFAAGVLFPIYTKSILLTRAILPDGTPELVGLRNTIDLGAIQYSLDALIPIPPLFGLMIPWGTILAIALICLFVTLFLRTKLGQEMRAMGHNLKVAKIMGIPVERNRLIATILSTVLAAWGQIIFLQNMGTFNTYSSHEQVGMFAIAALLVSGASVSRATIWQALIGTILFHTLFLTSPLAGSNLFGESQLGEYFRVFIAYGVISVALVIHALGKRERT